MRRQDELKAEQKLPTIEDCYIHIKLSVLIVRYYLIWEQVNQLCVKHSI